MCRCARSPRCPSNACASTCSRLRLLHLPSSWNVPSMKMAEGCKISAHAETVRGESFELRYALRESTREVSLPECMLERGQRANPCDLHKTKRQMTKFDPEHFTTETRWIVVRTFVATLCEAHRRSCHADQRSGARNAGVGVAVSARTCPSELCGTDRRG